MKNKQSMVAGTWETEPGRLQLQTPPGQHSKLMRPCFKIWNMKNTGIQLTREKQPWNNMLETISWYTFFNREKKYCLRLTTSIVSTHIPLRLTHMGMFRCCGFLCVGSDMDKVTGKPQLPHPFLTQFSLTQVPPPLWSCPRVSLQRHGHS